MAAPFINTNLFTSDGRLVTTVELPPFKVPVQVVLWGSRIFIWNPDRRYPAESGKSDAFGVYMEANGMCAAWTEEEKKRLGIY